MSEASRTIVARVTALYVFLLREANLADWPWWRATPVFVMRIITAVTIDLRRGLVSMRAMSLVYTTLLSLVPLLALSFSILKGFGYHNQLAPTLLELFAALGEKGPEVTAQVIGFVENVNVGVLGALGLGFLVLTVVSLMQKIERAFNFSWRITHNRPLAQRFTSYITVIVIGAVLVFSAVGIMASLVAAPMIGELTAIEPVGKLVAVAARLVPFVLIVVAFTFLYVFLPNTRVRIMPALAGGVFCRNIVANDWLGVRLLCRLVGAIHGDLFRVRDPDPVVDLALSRLVDLAARRLGRVLYPESELHRRPIRPPGPQSPPTRRDRALGATRGGTRVLRSRSPGDRGIPRQPNAVAAGCRG